MGEVVGGVDCRQRIRTRGFSPVSQNNGFATDRTKNTLELVVDCPVLTLQVRTKMWKHDRYIIRKGCDFDREKARAWENNGIEEWNPLLNHPYKRQCCQLKLKSWILNQLCSLPSFLPGKILLQKKRHLRTFGLHLPCHSTLVPSQLVDDCLPHPIRIEIVYSNIRAPKPGRRFCKCF